MTEPIRARAQLPWVLGLAALALGVEYLRHDLASELSGRGLRDLLHTLLLVLVATFVARRVLGLDPARGAALAFALVLAIGIGLEAIAWTLAVAAAAFVVGDRVLGSAASGPGAPDGSTRLLVGLALVAGLVGWLLPFPVHGRGPYALAVLVVVAAGWRRLAAVVRPALRSALRQPVPGGRMAWFAVVAIGCIALPAALPTAMPDDLAHHLALPTELSSLGHYRLDAATQVWALAPWHTNVVHGIVQVLAEREARGAVHLLWLGLGLVLLWRILGDAGLDPRWRWAGLALFASQPLQYQLAHSMQTELPTQVLLLALFRLVATVDASTAPRRLLATGAIVGALLGTKLVTVVYLAPFAAWFLWRWRSPRVDRLLPAALLMIGIGGSSYAWAWLVAGNPVLPLFNDLFASPFAPAERFADERYGPGNPLALPWRMLFDAGALHEGWNGIGGFQWWFAAALLPWLLATPRVRVPAWIGVVAILLLSTQIVHLRYALPALVPLGIALTILLARAAPRAGLALVVAIVALNLVHAQGASERLREGVLLRYVLAADGDRHFLERFAPDRLLLARLRASGEPFLVLADGLEARHAELAGRGVVANWYDPATRARFEAALAEDSAAGWGRLFVALGATHALVHTDRADPRWRAALARSGAVEASIGPVRLYRLDAGWTGSALAWNPGDAERTVDLPGTGERELSVVIEGRCGPAGGAVALAVAAMPEGATPPAPARDHQACAASEPFRLRVRLPLAASDRQAWIAIHDPASDRAPAADVASATIRVRRDLSAERDASRRLRGAAGG